MSAKDIKRLARKAWKADNARLEEPQDYERVVRAVLKAMREPTNSQYYALCRTDKMWREQTSETVWKTYIDALLADEP